MDGYMVLYHYQFDEGSVIFLISPVEVSFLVEVTKATFLHKDFQHHLVVRVLTRQILIQHY